MPYCLLSLSTAAMRRRILSAKKSVVRNANLHAKKNAARKIAARNVKTRKPALRKQRKPDFM